MVVDPCGKMKIFLTFTIFCVILGIASSQNVVHNFNPLGSNETVTTIEAGRGPGIGQVITGQQCTGNVGCTTSIVGPITKRCPVGYVLDNYICVRTQVISKTSEKIIKCYEGYHLSNGQCVRYSTSFTQHPLQYICPTGYTLNGNLCYPIVIDNPPVQPPVNQHPTFPPSTQGQLVQQPQCPAGFSYNGANCVQYIPNCPTGYQYSGRMCYPSCQGQITTNPCPYTQPQSTPCSYQNCPTSQQINPCCGSPTNPQVPPTVPVQPIPATPQCPPGLILTGNTCSQRITEPDTVPPYEACPDGYENINNECRRNDVDVNRIQPEIVCPEGSKQTAHGCVIEKCVNTTQNCVNTPPSGPTSWPSYSSGTNHLSNYITNHNPVNVTSNVNANSTSHVIVHLSNGETRVISDGEEKIIYVTPQTPVYPVTIPVPTPAPAPVPFPEKCCTVVSPRMCKVVQNGTWGCFHRRKEVCSSICDRPKIYLRPRQPVYRPPIMVVPPMRQRVSSCRGCSYQTAHDCSGCYSRGYCPQYCSRYACSSSSECGYMNQESYCQEQGGEFCSQEYGCLEGDYCEY
ncbi:uncharacterized protein K04H4.2 [Phlebotomus papatasi]|uniref:uncharacterized protein K04H4.2 n=1 Tax=Phlebotomus papatasi TaxID=29031 RepID=UPI00248384FE|nr:uncharacterized protein K04H4.2 [Phlebotomus papatasi]